MANPTTNYGFVLPTPTDLVTDLPADFDVALQGVDTRLKALQPGTTSGDLAYSSATANTNVRLPIGTSGQVLAVSGGGVPAWTTTADVTPLTTKGDLFTFTTIDARLAVGANDFFLQADSTAATGLKYGGSFTTYTPTIFQGVSVATSTAIGRFIKIGKFIHGSVLVVANATGTANNKVYVSIPAAAERANVFMGVGVSTFYDSSTALVYPSQVCVEDGQYFSFPISNANASNGTQYVGVNANTFTAAVATGDQIGFRFSYEVA